MYNRIVYIYKMINRIDRIYFANLMQKALYGGTIKYDHFEVMESMYSYIKKKTSCVFSNRITSDGFNKEKNKNYTTGVNTNIITRPDSIVGKWKDTESFT